MPVPGGANGLASFAVNVDTALPMGVDQIDNTVVVDDDAANGVDPNPGDNSASDSTPIIDVSGLSVR
jgi:hypothetical protein